MAHESYMRTVLETALELAAKNGGEVKAGDVSEALFTQTFAAHKRVLNLLSQLYHNGRLARIKQGVYGPLPSSGKVLEKREIMKNVVNMRKRVTVADLMEMADVNKEYAREWLKLMTDNGALRKEQAPGMAAIWYRVREIAELPNDAEKAARLREIRRKKKLISGKLNVIESAVGDIRTILDTIDKE